jgi:hypothetical protein
MESQIGPLIREMLKHEKPPKWQSPEHVALLKFIVFQLSRTRLARNEAGERTAKTMQKIEDLFPREFPELTQQAVDPAEMTRMLLKVSELNYHGALDLRLKLLRNETAAPFITSDHSVALSNQLFEGSAPIMSNTGLNSRGLQVFFPLNPHYTLIVFDADAYKVGGRNFNVVCVDAPEEDVGALNLLQVVNAGEHLYFSEEVDEKYVRTLAKKADRYLKNEGGTVNAGPAIVGGQEHGTIIATSRVDIRMELQLRSMKASPSAKRYAPSFKPEARYRDLRLQQLLWEFIKNRWRNEALGLKIRHSSPFRHRF